MFMDFDELLQTIDLTLTDSASEIYIFDLMNELTLMDRQMIADAAHKWTAALPICYQYRRHQLCRRVTSV